MRADDLPTTGLDLTPWPTHILDYVRTFFTNNNVALPGNQRIVPGMLSLDSWDCEQVSVGCSGLGDAVGQQGQTAGAPRTGNPYSALSTRQVVYGIQLVRCIGSCSAERPPNDVVNASGLQQLKDMGLLSQIVENLASAPPDWHPKGNVRAGDVVPLGPSGGYWAIEASITMSALDLLPAV